MVFRLDTWQLVLLLVVVVFGATLGWNGSRAAPVTPLRAPEGAVRRPAGGAARARRARTGVRARTRASAATRRAAWPSSARPTRSARRTSARRRSPSRCGRESLDLLKSYTDANIRLSNAIPGSAAHRAAIADGNEIQRELWSLAGDALADRPVDSAPRMYVETLNEMIDMETVRVSTLNNRVPGAVLVVEVLGAAFALGLLFVLPRRSSGEASCPCCSRQASSRCCSSSPSTSTARPRADPGSGLAARRAACRDGATSGGGRSARLGSRNERARVNRLRRGRGLAAGAAEVQAAAPPALVVPHGGLPVGRGGAPVRGLRGQPLGSTGDGGRDRRPERAPAAVLAALRLPFMLAAGLPARARRSTR